MAYDQGLARRWRNNPAGLPGAGGRVFVGRPMADAALPPK